MSLSFPLRDRVIHTEAPAFVMGILNITPDSFYAKSRATRIDAAVERALELEAAGVDVIDIGGESSQPGSSYVSELEEMDRVIPVVQAIRARSTIPLSIDTRKSAVMKAAIDLGADICNDISALEDDPDLPDLLARTDTPVILMHKRGTPETMQNDPCYDNLLADVCLYLRTRAEFAISRGIKPDRIIFDPGIGFGKCHEDNLSLIAGFPRLCKEGYPVLMALSRKTCIGQITGREPDGRLAGSLAANQMAVLAGASWLRVHDVSETKDMLAVIQELIIYGIR